MIKGFLAVLVVSLLITSCQEDSISENTEALSHKSTLTTTLMSMSVNETDIDNAIDKISCFNIKLPVRILVNDQQIVVSNENDYATVEAVFNVSSLDNDKVTFIFPITVVYSDYKEVVVNNQQEYDALVDACTGIPEYIGTSCVSIVYPITIYGYDSGFKMQNTYVLKNNAELFTTLQNLSSSEYYSISYPLSLNVNKGSGVTVKNNNKFLEAVTYALQGCKEGGCTNPGILVNDLVIYMPFSNGIVKELKGNAVNFQSNIAFTTDRNGNQNCAIVFNGTQFLHIPKNDSNGIVQNDPFSISLWFRMQNVNNDDLENLFTKGNMIGEGFELSVFNLNAPMFRAGALNIKDIEWSSSAVLPTDVTNWHHLVVTVDASNTVKLYRDGELRNSSELSSAQIGTQTMDYYIGNNFRGFMDDLRVYKRLLSPDEVQVLFKLEGDCNTCLE